MDKVVIDSWEYNMLQREFRGAIRERSSPFAPVLVPATSSWISP